MRIDLVVACKRARVLRSAASSSVDAAFVSRMNHHTFPTGRARGTCTGHQSDPGFTSRIELPPLMDGHGRADLRTSAGIQLGIQYWTSRSRRGGRELAAAPVTAAGG
jgi:hypothetical protein